MGILTQQSFDDVKATLEVLERGGVSPDHWSKPRRDQGMAVRVAAAFTDALAIIPVSTDLARLVPTPAHMLADVRGLVIGSHGFTAEAFALLERMPTRQPLGNFPLVLPVIYLNTLQATVEFWWEVCKRRYSATWQWPDLKLGAKSLRVWDPAGSGKGLPWGNARLAWVGLDLLAYYDPKDGTKVEGNRAKENAPMPGVEILALMALAPALGQVMDGGTANGGRMPWLDMPGLEAGVSGFGPWSVAPCVRFGRGGRRLRLDGGRVGSRGRNFASPAFRECLPA